MWQLRHAIRAWDAALYLDGVHFEDEVLLRWGAAGPELAVRWYPWRDGEPPRGVLEVPSYSWANLPSLSGVLELLAEDEKIQPREFCRRLVEDFGFQDATPRRPGYPV